MMKGEYDKEFVEKLEVLVFLVFFFLDDFKFLLVQNGILVVLIEDEMYVFRECLVFFILNLFNIIYMFEFELLWRRFIYVLFVV